MKRGTKPLPPAMKQERGTLQPCRDAHRFEADTLTATESIATPNGLPQRPEWLTEAGYQVWLDDVGRASSHRLATESDSSMFANYCNLQGAIVRCWESGNVPPASHLMEARRMAEQFGIFGRKSRVLEGAPASGGDKGNPFANNGRRS